MTVPNTLSYYGTGLIIEVKKLYDTGPRREGVIIKLLKAARVPREIENVSRLESQHNEK